MNGPRLLVQGFRENNSVSISGPVVVELYRLTMPGAAVKINGNPFSAAKDGMFEYSVF